MAGVGYRVTVSPRTLAELAPDTDAFVYVHHHLREDAQTLYGFTTRDERATFEALLGAHGVGPALALAALSVHTPEQLRAAVRAGDLDALCLVPGVGKKTAARLLLELRSRFDGADAEVGDVVAHGRRRCRRGRPWPTCARRSPGWATAAGRDPRGAARAPGRRRRRRPAP